MKKSMLIAAAAVAGMCAAAQASGTALDALARSVSKDVLVNSSIAAAVGPAESAMAKDAAAGLGRAGSYSNDKGCTVTVERRANGSMVYVQDGGQQATLGVLRNFSGGDIFAFCSPAVSSLNGDTLTLSCGAQDNGGYQTRGQAVVEMAGGVSAVYVRGEVRKGLGWKTDTSIACENLKPVRSKLAGSADLYRPDWPVFMGVEACSGVDGVYPDGMSKAEALDMLEGCFGGISKEYKVPVTVTAGDDGLVLLVGKAENAQMGSNAAVAQALRKELAKRGGRIFDYEVSIAVAK